ncbi:hypothetical protein SK128_002944 [Halocaridina rubra]|uniref:Uncharacterized protein n=1 Tax=Halocaridina rubra TaxID=373956 RepID=A0AAN8ZSX5_HALRR
MDATVAVTEPVVPKRNMLQAVKEIIPQSVCNSVMDFLQQEKYYIVAVVAAVGAVKITSYIKKQKKRKEWNSVGKDVVVVHTFERTKVVPNLSPFALKLETYLRMADIKYELDFTEPMGPKGKSPWITLNGESIADSQLIVEALGKKFNKNFSSHLTSEQLGIAQAMRIMTEEHLFWCYEIWMCITDKFASLIKIFPMSFSFQLLFPLFRGYYERKIKKTVYIVGIGRHTDQEVYSMACKDLDSLSAWLGCKEYFTGDKPTEVDCAIFGFLAQLVWVIPHSPIGQKIKDDCKNLEDFCNRMKTTFWPDWNEQLHIDRHLEEYFHYRTMLQMMKEVLPDSFHNTITEFIQEKKYYILATVAAVGVVKIGTFIQQQSRRRKWNAVGKDVVVVHTFPRAKCIPNLSPFALKLETYLRMADIKYELDTMEPMGPKGKSPWITVNGESIADSQLIIEALGRKFNKNFSSHLTLEQIGIAQAMRVMTEEHLFWCYEVWMCLTDQFRSFTRAIPMPITSQLLFPFFKTYFTRRIKKTLHAVGIGRHSEQEIFSMACKDLNSLSAWLGNKKYFTGDMPTEVDCAIFGVLAQLVFFIPHSPVGQKIEDDCKNLEVFCNRMVEKFWPDWDQQLHHDEKPVLQTLRDLFPEPVLHKAEKMLQGNIMYYVGAFGIAVGTIIAWVCTTNKIRRQKWNAVGRDVVVLHTVKRARSTPAVSPFALKLETYLRMADIPYEVDMTKPWGPKGKCPWITVNGEDIADSQLTIEALTKKFNKYMDSHLTLEEKSIARAMRVMMEEHFFCCLQVWMFLDDGFVSFRRAFNFPFGPSLLFSILLPFFKYKINRAMHAVGMRRHTSEEVEEMGRKDIMALSLWLGDKNYFMGAQPSEVDCAIFGFLAQLLWHFPHSPYGKFLHTECINLIAYCNRMRDKFWPDWKQNLDPPQTDTSFKLK